MGPCEHRDKLKKKKTLHQAVCDSIVFELKTRGFVGARYDNYYYTMERELAGSSIVVQVRNVLILCPVSCA